MIAAMLWLYVLFYAIISQVNGEDSKPDLVLHLDILKNCNEDQHFPMDIVKSGFVINPKTGLQYIQMDLNVTENIPKELNGIVSIEKCRSKESPDTCIKLAAMKSKEPCTIGRSKYYGVKSFLECVGMSCPVKKGLYKSRGCYMNFSMFKMFPLAGSYWKVRAELFDRKNRQLSCAIGSGMFKRNHE